MKNHLAVKQRVDWKEEPIKVAACRGGVSFGITKLNPREFFAKHKEDESSTCSHCLREFNKLLDRAKEKAEREKLKKEVQD